MEENKNTTIDNENNTGVENTAGSSTENQENETKTYTQEEVLSLIQKEADKRVTQALATQEKKFQKQLSLSKLDDVARERAEKDDKIAELEAQLAQFQIEKNKSELKSVLSNRGLSAEFADILNITDDIAASQACIDKLDRLFKKAVTAEVEKRLAASGGTPKASKTTDPNEITRETTKKMTVAELEKLANEQPELFNKLFN